ncbi:Uncharacterized protein HZ326_29360 [Fusarium oxysporum f. sp. albedinis]|nr:Uncharacterized protein HZ326_29360 [Fusarium oxysporum f. sp. albedinis]
MSCGQSMWLMVSKLELWLVSLTVMLALVSRVLRTRVEYEEQHCLSISSSNISVPIGIFTSLGNPKDRTRHDEPRKKAWSQGQASER